MLLLSKKERLILLGLAILMVVIPVSSYIISFRFKAQTKVQAKPLPSPRVVAQSTALDELKKALELATSSAKPPNEGSSQVFFGPTLSFKVNLEGRPIDKQASKVFVGLVQGSTIGPSPEFLLSFVVDMPDSGIYSGLSLAGLSQNNIYTAYFKGPAQIATASSFLVKPTINDIGTVKMATGDLNEDNIINDADLKIAMSAYGSNPASQNWNANADFNVDRVVNSLDISILSKNLDRAGSSGVWYSQTATKSGTPVEFPIGGPDSTSGGYWMWVPRID